MNTTDSLRPSDLALATYGSPLRKPVIGWALAAALLALIIFIGLRRSGRWERGVMVEQLREEVGTPSVTPEEYTQIEGRCEPPRKDKTAVRSSWRSATWPSASSACTCTIDRWMSDPWCRPGDKTCSNCASRCWHRE